MTKCIHECFCLNSWQSQMFLFIYTRMFAGCPKSKMKKSIFLYLCIRYIYIQRNVHNVHSTVLCSVHTTEKKKRLLVNYVKRIKT